jgi:tetratricopeptide (TPR) repeat protein
VLFQEDEHYVSKDNYPLLYSLAQKAADVLHCSNKIRIAILDDFSAGIARVGDTYSIQIGVILLNTLSQDELYCILLHEFSHMVSENNSVNKERDYHTWVQQGTNPHFLSGLTNSWFVYLDSLYSLQFGLYLYASSISIESAADSAMVKYGDAKAAASALLKLKCYELYSWEKGTYDEECHFKEETPRKDYLTQELNSFLNRLNLRKEAWINYASVEIMSRATTHPTVKMRLESLGITSLEVLENFASDSYITECKRALSYMDELLHNELIKEYDTTRTRLYMEPKELIESWELAGKPIKASEYSDIGFALRQLGRNSEALELYQQAISELSTDAESCNARFFRGCFLLHQFDASGLVDIYCAIECNSNYIDEGLSIIGRFCCLTGNQDELNIYREKAIELAQRQKDVYSHIGTLTKNDHLSSEQLPDGMLDDILSYISTIDEGSINEIYLVRKTITEDFFTSAFVIRFNINISEKKKEEVMHKIFSYLDTCSSWQFSLFDFTELRDIKFVQIENSCVFKQAKTQTD